MASRMKNSERVAPLSPLDLRKQHPRSPARAATCCLLCGAVKCYCEMMDCAIGCVSRQPGTLLRITLPISSIVSNFRLDASSETPVAADLQSHLPLLPLRHPVGFWHILVVFSCILQIWVLEMSAEFELYIKLPTKHNLLPN